MGQQKKKLRYKDPKYNGFHVSKYTKDNRNIQWRKLEFERANHRIAFNVEKLIMIFFLGLGIKVIMKYIMRHIVKDLCIEII